MSLSLYFTASDKLQAAVRVYYITHHLGLQTIEFKIRAKLSSGKPKRIYTTSERWVEYSNKFYDCQCVCGLNWPVSQQGPAAISLVDRIKKLVGPRKQRI